MKIKTIAENLLWLWIYQYIIIKEEKVAEIESHPLYKRWVSVVEDGGDWTFPKWLFRECIDELEGK